jgi:PfaB family protein
LNQYIEKDNTPAIAVVSMSGVFPKAIGMERYWHNIINRVDGAVEVPESRWIAPADWVFQSSPSQDKAYSKRACLVQDFRFDPNGYELDASVLSEVDSLHQWTLFAARDALSRMNSETCDRSRIGIILAAIALPTDTASTLSRLMLGDEIANRISSANAAGNSVDQYITQCARVVASPAALVAFALGITGGSYTLDAACASSLYALKLACDELVSRRADLMLTGGVSGADSLYTQIGFSQLKALSASGRCAPFDQGADGLVVGEGAGVLALKRLDDAVAAGDTILGVIRGIGLSNDMRGNLLAPESAGQLRAMQAAYAQAGWKPSDVDYIECHGAGTPVGDATELASLMELWKDASREPGQCVLGAAKSMVGHLLTGAGAAGMIRTLLGLNHGTLPPTLNFETPPVGSPLHEGPFRVLPKAEKWSRRDRLTPRRAAVSAFGFGGINAHVLLEEYTPEQKMFSKSKDRGVVSEASAPAADSSRGTAIAIVGLETILGSLTSRQTFTQAVFNGRPAFVAPPQHRWKAKDALNRLFLGKLSKGGFIEDLSVTIGEFQIPPGEIPDILPQQLLMLKAAAGALSDAGLPLRQVRPRMGTVIGIAFDYEAANFHLRWALPHLVEQWRRENRINIDNSQIDAWIDQLKDGCGPPLTSTRTLGALGGIVASRIAREFRFGGPSFVVSAEELSGLRALEISMRMLQEGLTDAMLVGAVDLTCDERNLATLFSRLSFSSQSVVAPFDKLADGIIPGEGAVSLVLKRLDDAKTAGDRIYAVIEGVGSAGGGNLTAQETSAHVYQRSLENAVAQAGIATERITLVETHGSGIPAQDDAESTGLHSFFANPDGSREKGIAIGTLMPVVGHAGAASGLAAVAKTALCLHHQLVSPALNFKDPRLPGWHSSPFYFPRRATYWAHNRSAGPRTACTAAMGNDGNCMHVILRECDREEPDVSLIEKAACRRPLGALPQGLFLFQGRSEQDLLHQLNELSQRISRASVMSDAYSMDVLENLAYQWHQRSAASTNTPNASLAIVADSMETLDAHLSGARRAVEAGEPREMTQRGGIAYLPMGAQARGKAAFVFPGSGNHYVGMGRTLGAHWPEILRRMDKATDHLQSQLLPHLYDPWRSEWSAGWQSRAYQALIEDPLSTIFGQVLFGGQMAHLLAAFNISPEAVIGYSLGESAGLFAMGVWPDRGEMLRRLERSDLFKTRLAGPCEAVRTAWNIPDDHVVQWHVAAVNAPADEIDRVISDLPWVRRLIINTPGECVIGGLKEHVTAAIQKLKCNAVVLDGVVAVHCDAALPAARAYKELHRFPTTPVDGLSVYSCAWGKTYDLSSEAAADSILHQALHGFDFPRTIEQAYADGIRVFIEVGPHTSCTRMIGHILKDKPHLAVSANNRSEDECLTLLKCLGTLAAAGMAVDITPLYGYPSPTVQMETRDPTHVIRVPVGGSPLTIPALPRQPALSPEKPVKIDKPVEKTILAPPADPTPYTEPELSAGTAGSDFENLLNEFNDTVRATAQAHEHFLDLSREMQDQFKDALHLQSQLFKTMAALGMEPDTPAPSPQESPAPSPQDSSVPVAFNREQCMEFAVGKVGRVLGPRFDEVDTYAARVRLPDEPLMLVDRILSVEGEMCGLGAGRVVTEHDVLPGAWYLDGNRAPVCISVEAGQADLFLSSYLGIDHQVQGKRTYRLLDAKIVFHRGLPQPGETIRYDIHIDKFVKQGRTYLFFFRYEGHIGNEHLITMTEGCAGFFTEQEVTQSGGIILTDEDRRVEAHINGNPYVALLPLTDESYDDARIDALRQGDAHACFGDHFKGIRLPRAMRLPGGRMRLIHRIVALQPRGGRFGKGMVKAEADIAPDNWFLTCHFVDDMVMPGTLMYECCAHTLRVLLLRMGWVSEKENICYEPVRGVPCRLKCRGPVTPGTKKVHYVVEIKEMGYHPEPYVIADAHMYADGHYIVFFKDMTMQVSGLTQQDVETFWERRPTAAIPEPSSTAAASPLFTRDHILEFAVGKPSMAFGDPYRVFDGQRTIARLPGPPYCFMDRILSADPKPWVLEPDGWVTAQYDVPADDWYFAADRSGCMPFCVLLEIALQPCGWLAAYLGSALRSDTDLKFRNLGGRATVHRNLYPVQQTLTMRTRLTKISEAADMIIEHFDFEVLVGEEPVYSGNTYFGFFTAQALAQQKGLREAVYAPTERELIIPAEPTLAMDAPLDPDGVAAGGQFTLSGLTLPAKALLMIDTIEEWCPDGGPHGLGFIRGSKRVDPGEWFFKAHFYQDPVCPGSLGVESFLQLIKYAALQRWPELAATHVFETLCGKEHQWSYRGQVIPANTKVCVDAVITRIENGSDPVIMADGWLQVDGLPIYKMENFGLRLRSKTVL